MGQNRASEGDGLLGLRYLIGHIATTEVKYLNGGVRARHSCEPSVSMFASTATDWSELFEATLQASACVELP